MSAQVLRAARLALGIVFIAAGLAKAGHVPAFGQAVSQYKLFPEDSGAIGIRLAGVLVAALPWIEVFVGAALVSGIGRRGALWLAALLCASFAVAKASLLWRGIEVDACGCFGETFAFLDRSGLTGLALPALLLGLAALLIHRERLLGRPRTAAQPQ